MSRFDMPELAARLSLLAAGGRRAPLRQLLQRHGSARAVLSAGPMAWRTAGVREDACIRIRAGADPDTWLRTAEWMQQEHHHVIAWHEDSYPAALRTVSGAPLLLFAAGDIALLQTPAIAIVGTRAPTAGGRAQAEALATELAACGLTITSGMAAGIDGAAHQGCLDADGDTIAVVGTGPDVAYPERHRVLQARIERQGLVISEHPPGTQAMRSHFPARNRIIAGLSLATVVVEAAARSGALITARMAADAGREVFAVPGSLQNPQACGCHRLIREGARLLQSHLDVLHALAPELARCLSSSTAGALPIGAPNDSSRFPPRPSTPQQTTPQPIPSDWNGDHKTVWSALGHDPTAMDTLVDRTALTPARLSAILLDMELSGAVSVAHGRYHRGARVT